MNGQNETRGGGMDEIDREGLIEIEQLYTVCVCAQCSMNECESTEKYKNEICNY